LTPTVYFNGELITESAASIGIHNGGWLHGAGVFETMRAEQGRVFRLESHLARLHRSVSVLLAHISRDALPGEQDVSEMLSRNGLGTARVRLTVSAGSMLEGQQVGTDHQLTVCGTASPLTGYPSTYYENGVSVVVCPFRLSPSDPVAGHKTTSYLPRLLALRHARQLRAAEALWFTTANRLAEGAISNVLLARDGSLRTPPLDTPVLPGIARGVVLEIARELSLTVEETPITIGDLLDADEVLLTNALMQVVPVIRIEKHDVGNGRVGPLAKRLLTEYCRLVKHECATS
jgi:branched-chain amino acid aminotransferase